MYGIVLKSDLDKESLKSLKSTNKCRKECIYDFESYDIYSWKEYRKYWKCVRLNVELDTKTRSDAK